MCNIIHTKLGIIEYAMEGHGTPVLVLHGGHSNCEDILCRKGFDLNKYQLIIPSRPGYGKTPLGNNKTPRQTADLIMALLVYFPVDKIVVYGISAGGLTAIELAANYPHKVEKLILASAVTKEWLDKKGKTYQTAIRIFNPHVQGMLWGMIRFFAKIFPDRIAKNFYPQLSKKKFHRLRTEDVRELIAALNKYCSGYGFFNDIDQIPPADDERTISKIECPTLIIHSEYDNSVPLEHAQYAHQLITNSRLEILQNEWGHLFWVGADSSESIEKIIEFIEG